MPWTDSLRRARTARTSCVWIPCGWCRSGAAVRWCGLGWCRRPGRRVAGLLALAVDQLGEPAHLAVHGVQAVPLQLQGVAVQLLLGATQRVHQPVPLALDGAPATLQDPQPHVGGRVPEEGQVDAEATLVVVGLRPGLADQFGEALLALRGDRVDDLAAAPGQRRGVG